MLKKMVFALAIAALSTGPAMAGDCMEGSNGASCCPLARADDTFLDAHKNLAILCITQNPMYQNTKRTEMALKHFKRYEELGGTDDNLKRIHATLLSFIQRQPRENRSGPAGFAPSR